MDSSSKSDTVAQQQISLVSATRTKLLQRIFSESRDLPTGMWFIAVFTLVGIKAKTELSVELLSALERIIEKRGEKPE